MHGEVYLAEDPLLMRAVAIKVISKNARTAPDAEIRFLLPKTVKPRSDIPDFSFPHQMSAENPRRLFLLSRYVVFTATELSCYRRQSVPGLLHRWR